MIVGCYSLDLYCDTGHRKDGTTEEYNLADPGQFTGQTEGDCKRDARRAGWLFRRDGTVYCRECVKTGRVPK